ncbi:MAG: CDC27 family protein [Selenomonadaceae bacterium]|nr:CDC27 family protein [Selenomonadaceae bacterium]
MGFLEELGKAALEGVAEGIKKSQQQRKAQEWQDIMREFIAHEREIQSEGEKGDLDAIQMLTTVYYRQGDYQKAAYWGRKGASFDDEICLYMMGETAYAQEDYDAAANFFERNVNVHGNILSATALGNMYLGIKDYSNAKYYFDFVLRRDKSNSEAAFGLAVCKMEDEDPYLEDIEELMQVAARSDNHSTRDAAQQILQQIQAEKTKRANQNNCFVTTAVCDSFGKPDDCYELTAFRKFRDGWLSVQPDGKSLIAEYYAIAPRIVANINRLTDAAQIYKSIWQKYLEPCLRFIERGDNLSCKNKYVDMIRELKKIYD